jgi:hypothetical protein
MARYVPNFRVLLAMAIASLALLLISGCASSQESDNRSERPWNAPKSWETGLPMGVGEQRR